MIHNNNIFRQELKYYISFHEYVYLKKRLEAALEKDRHTLLQDNGYHVRSLYFDDIYKSALNEKISGLGERKKYRIRIYNHSDALIRMEKKIKYDQYIAKMKENMTKEEFYQLLRQDYDFLLNSEKVLFREFYAEIKNKLLKPVVIVDYEREAYTVVPGNVRITFDKNLQAGFSTYDIFAEGVAAKNVFEKPVMILEIKYDTFLPTYVLNLLQISSHNLSAASKYVLCHRAVKDLKIN